MLPFNAMAGAIEIQVLGECAVAALEYSNVAVAAKGTAPALVLIAEPGYAQALASLQALRFDADAATARTPALVLAPFAMSGDELERLYGLGPVDHLYAPYPAGVLRAKIAALARPPRQPDATLLRQLQAANSTMVDIFRQAPAFICMLRGPTHVFEMANERYLSLVGRRDIIGMPVRAAFPEVAGQGFFELLDRVYDSGVTFNGAGMQIELLREDGVMERRQLDFVYMAMRDADARVTGVLVHGVDQSARNLAEQASRTSEERYRTLFESVDEGFCIIEMMFDAAGKPVDYLFLEMNPAFEAHTGLSGAIGRTARELVPDLNQFWYEVYGRVATSGVAERFVNEAVAMSRWFDVYASRLGGPGSAKVAVLFNDISKRKLAEIELRQLASDLEQANRRQSEFLAILAHELRNPLAPVRSGLQLMRQSGALPDSLQQVGAMMERQVGNMVHIVDDLLDVARITSGKIELKRQRIDLAQVVATAVETSAPAFAARGQHLTLVMPDVPDVSDASDYSLPMDADATRVVQVISNLLNNAAKYTPHGGAARLSVARDGDDAVIAVSDSGIGIAPTALALVFDMFTQVGRDAERTQGGLGIGLSLVRRLVELHGGSVTAASAGLGQGSCFTVRLPLAPGAAMVAPMPAAPAPIATAGLRVLVVDDNTDAADMIASLIDLHGHQTRVAHDGVAALVAARELQPQLIFLDIGLPRRDGYQVAQDIRAEASLAGVFLVALTGWGAQDDLRRAAEAGFDRHLTKPVAFDAIVAILAEVSARSDCPG